MALSSVDICNQAAAHLGTSEIQSIESPTTRDERLFASLFRSCRDSVLSAVNWGFARKYKALALVSEEETGFYSYAYALPSDCLVPRALVPLSADSTPPPFETILNAAGTAKILICDESSPVLEYTSKVELASVFTMDFAEVFAVRLAAMACYALKGDPSRAKQLESDYDALRRKAEATNANSGNRPYSDQCDLLDARS